jgi:phospholipid/cholesterol/gamma-HCH transport system substrate-binding protein
MRLRNVVAAVAVAGLLSTGCSGSSATEVNAVFDDAADLTSGHAVKIADVQVGTVKAVELSDDYEAHVRLAVDPEIRLPADVSARLRKTNLLGERYVELLPGDSSEPFKSGATVSQTSTVPELEEVVSSGTDVLIAVAADRLAGAINSGAEGLDGRGETFGKVLSDLNVIVDAYENNSDDLVRLINGFDQFMADVGPRAGLHGRALGELKEFTQVLEEEDERLIDALNAVQDLAVTGTDIIKTHREDFDEFFVRFNTITHEIARQDQQLEELISNAHLHNYNTIRGINAEQAQVFFDFIICGLNDDPGDPVRACTNPPQGAKKPQPRPKQDYGQGER